MATLQDVSKLQLRVETLIVRDGFRLGRLRPDENGYYHHIPMAVFGIQTRNNTYYDVPAFVQQIQDPSSMFNQRLVGKQLYGEWGHPAIAGMEDMAALNRLAEIREDRYSHFIKDVNIGKTLESGGKILEATIKPTGPFKQSLLDSLEDPFMNTAFSLRAITRAEQRGMLSYRTMRKLITFDAVGAGGSFEASKGFSGATENFDHFDISLLNANTAVFSQCALESFSDSELNEFFHAPVIQRKRQIITLATNKTPSRFSRFTEKNLHTLYHETIRE